MAPFRRKPWDASGKLHASPFGYVRKLYRGNDSTYLRQIANHAVPPYASIMPVNRSVSSLGCQQHVFHG
jgi:hypothetical protein